MILENQQELSWKNGKPNFWRGYETSNNLHITPVLFQLLLFYIKILVKLPLTPSQKYLKSEKAISFITAPVKYLTSSLSFFNFSTSTEGAAFRKYRFSTISRSCTQNYSAIFIPTEIDWKSMSAA